MEKNNNLTTLFHGFAESEKPPIVQLLNHDRVPVAALYLDKLRCRIEDVVICESKTDEKYYLYMDGIAVFFTYYQKF